MSALYCIIKKYEIRYIAQQVIKMHDHELVKESLRISPDRPFSWSYFRLNLFNKCQRAYFFHYYGAQNGWDPYADSRSQHIHKLKNLKLVDQWLEDVFIKSLRKLFIAPRPKRSSPTMPQVFKNIIIKYIDTENREYTAHECDDDHRKLNLFESYYGQVTDHFSIRAYAKKKLFAAVDQLAGCAIFNELCAVKYFQWKSFSPPIYAYIDRKQVWAAPALIWSDAGIYNVLNLRLTEPVDDFPISLGISAIYLAQRLRVTYDKIHCRKVFLHHTTDIYSGHCPIDDLHALIETSSSEMRARMTDDGCAVESEFPKCNDLQKCATCNFKELCFTNT